MFTDRSRANRQRAAELLARAKQIVDVPVRASLIAMAQKWLDRAERAEYGIVTTPLYVGTVRVAVGQELRASYEPPRQLPHRLLTLLIQLNG